MVKETEIGAKENGTEIGTKENGTEMDPFAEIVCLEVEDDDVTFARSLYNDS